MAVHVLGLSAFGHGSAAVLLRDGEIVAAAEEERFSRRKRDDRFPARAIAWCFAEAGIRADDLARLAVHGDADRPCAAIRRASADAFGLDPGERFVAIPRDRAHAASTFFAGPFERAAVLCIDGAGAPAPTSAWIGESGRLKPLWAQPTPHGLGLIYSAFTEYCGFRVNGGEYKLMGLAAYGEPRWTSLIRDRLIEVGEDGRFRIATEYFEIEGDRIATNARFHALFGGPPRTPAEPPETRHLDLARSIQCVVEDVLLRLGRAVQRTTGADRLCLGGAVALNCVAAGRLLREGPFGDVWVQPAAGEAGGALGAALAVWHDETGAAHAPPGGADRMRGAFLGPAFDDAAIEATLAGAGGVWRRLGDDELFPWLAARLARGEVVGWMQDRMEFGPRALGARSILADPREPGMQARLNGEVKYREAFRPFAPAIPLDALAAWFRHNRPSPYMSFTAPVAQPGLPAITHVDGSARLQTVDAATNPRFLRLLHAFEAQTGCPVLLNTSFNVRGEPIVCTPADAWRCFMRTDIDHLVVGNHVASKRDQPLRLREGVRPRKSTGD